MSETHLAAAAQKVQRLEAQLRIARAERDLEIVGAHIRGLTERAIASAVGISGPAVHQILARRRLAAVDAARVSLHDVHGRHQRSLS